MLVNVKQEHIDNGKVAIPSSCPIALAIMETEPTLNQVSVGPFSGFIVRNQKVVHIYLPESAVTFIDQFDKEQKVAPFTFELREEPHVR